MPETVDTYLTTSVDMARYIVEYGNRNRVSMNITKAQKLLYIVYGMFLAEKDARLFSEHPQCWPYGPVFPSTRKNLLRERSLSDIHDTTSNAELNGLIASVFDKYGAQSATWLSEWSHQKNSPWDKTTQKIGFIWGAQIDDEDIKEYFKQL